MFILGMLPTRMGDGTLHTDEQLRSMSRAITRVRFQFRRDAEGVMQVYGIHTGASGDDSVRTVGGSFQTSTRSEKHSGKPCGMIQNFSISSIRMPKIV
ncbi:S-type pyocin domain-containing protein [Pseudomonas sp. PHC1]|uniref:S-type pyocin domain-containing protein n=1 Tax=Pseudomonas sp. PHC1 TaxID=3384759 RepID=UPI00396F3A66